VESFAKIVKLSQTNSATHYSVDAEQIEESNPSSTSCSDSDDSSTEFEVIQSTEGIINVVLIGGCVIKWRFFLLCTFKQFEHRKVVVVLTRMTVYLLLQAIINTSTDLIQMSSMY